MYYRSLSFVLLPVTIVKTSQIDHRPAIDFPAGARIGRWFRWSNRYQLSLTTIDPNDVMGVVGGIGIANRWRGCRQSLWPLTTGLGKSALISVWTIVSSDALYQGISSLNRSRLASLMSGFLSDGALRRISRTRSIMGLLKFKVITSMAYRRLSKDKGEH